MIIVRSPLRISLGGGGTDLPSYYLENTGFVISAAIDKYVYINLLKPFENKISLKYSSLELVNKVSDIEHPIIRECLEYINPSCTQIEITSVADIPSGTGLGSSGSFTCALLKGLHIFQNKSVDARRLAEMACFIEIDQLKQPIGKQDQYISAFGGITSFEFTNSKTNVNAINLDEKIVQLLNDHLLLFFTGYNRSANSILEEQNSKSIVLDDEMIQNLNQTKELGKKIEGLLINGNLTEFGMLMNEHWMRKKKRSSLMTNKRIDFLYQLAVQNGAIGGKVVGAGGGGFLMFYASDPEKLRNIMKKHKIEELKFTFDFEGTRVV